MSFASLPPALTRQKLCVDLYALYDLEWVHANEMCISGSLKHACSKGVYVAPIPDEPLLWAGVLFVRKGEKATTTDLGGYRSNGAHTRG